MINISGFNMTAQVTASRTFPNGFTITEFADDADPLDSPDLELADTAMGLNGDMVVWSRPQGIEVALSVIATSDADLNLEAIFEANRVGKNKLGARDNCGIVIAYPSGAIATLSEGVMVTGTALPAISSAGRYKTRTYRFRFQNISRKTAPAETV